MVVVLCLLSKSNISSDSNQRQASANLCGMDYHLIVEYRLYVVTPNMRAPSSAHLGVGSDNNNLPSWETSPQAIGGYWVGGGAFRVFDRLTAVISGEQCGNRHDSTRVSRTLVEYITILKRVCWTYTSGLNILLYKSCYLISDGLFTSWQSDKVLQMVLPHLFLLPPEPHLGCI